MLACSLPERIGFTRVGKHSWITGFRESTDPSRFAFATEELLCKRGDDGNHRLDPGWALSNVHLARATLQICEHAHSLHFAVASALPGFGGFFEGSEGAVSESGSFRQRPQV